MGQARVAEARDGIDRLARGKGNIVPIMDNYMIMDPVEHTTQQTNAEEANAAIVETEETKPEKTKKSGTALKKKAPARAGKKKRAGRARAGTKSTRAAKNRAKAQKKTALLEKMVDEVLEEWQDMKDGEEGDQGCEDGAVEEEAPVQQYEESESEISEEE